MAARKDAIDPELLNPPIKLSELDKMLNLRVDMANKGQSPTVFTQPIKDPDPEFAGNWYNLYAYWYDPRQPLKPEFDFWGPEYSHLHLDYLVSKDELNGDVVARFRRPAGLTLRAPKSLPPGEWKCFAYPQPGNKFRESMSLPYNRGDKEPNFDKIVGIVAGGNALGGQVPQREIQLAYKRLYEDKKELEKARNQWYDVLRVTQTVMDLLMGEGKWTLAKEVGK